MAPKPKPKPVAKRKPGVAKRKPAAKAKEERRPSARSKAKTAPAAKRKADKAAAAAKAAGATGSRLSAAKQQLRDSQIIARRAQGLSNAMIAAEVGITERSVERVLQTRRGVRSPLDDSPMQLLEELAVGFRLAIGDYQAMAVAWFDVNQAAALGALKAADETRVRLATMLADVGKLPTNLELFRSEMEMARIAAEMTRMMRAVAAGEIDASEAVEFYVSVTHQHEQKQLEAGTG